MFFKLKIKILLPDLFLVVAG